MGQLIGGVYKSDYSGDEIDERLSAVPEKAMQDDIAYVYGTSVSPSTINAGSYFYYNGALYIATSIISPTATPIPGTNCKIVQLASELSATKGIIATEFTPAPYAPGTYCIHNGVLYRCVNATSGSWNDDAFEAVTVGNDLAAHKTSILNTEKSLAPERSTVTPEVGKYFTIDGVLYRWTQVQDGASQAAIVSVGNELFSTQASLAPEYSSSSTYAVGDYCTRGGVLYRCTTAITTPEDWTAAHWTAVSVGGDIVSYLPTQFAPAGYGLGGIARQIATTDNIDNLTDGGFYYCSSTVAASVAGTTPFGSSGFGMLVMPMGTGSTPAAAQIAVKYISGSGTGTEIKLRFVRSGAPLAWQTIALT